MYRFFRTKTIGNNSPLGVLLCDRDKSQSKIQAIKSRLIKDYPDVGIKEVSKDYANEILALCKDRSRQLRETHCRVYNGAPTIYIMDSIDIEKDCFEALTALVRASKCYILFTVDYNTFTPSKRVLDILLPNTCASGIDAKHLLSVLREDVERETKLLKQRSTKPVLQIR